MDPVSAIGLLASLSSLIKASNTVLSVIKSLKDAEKEFLELYNDVFVFEEALKGFDRVLRSRQTKHNVSEEVIKSALEEASTTIQDLEKRLVQISKSDISAVRRMKWAQYRSSLKKTHDRLKEQSTMLQNFLTLAHAFVTPSTKPTKSRLIWCTVKHSLHSAVNVHRLSSATRVQQRVAIAMPCRFRILACPTHQRFSQVARRLRSGDPLSILPLHP